MAKSELDALPDLNCVRDFERRRLEAIREATLIGDQSGPGMPAAEVFAQLRQMLADKHAHSPHDPMRNPDD